MQDTQDLKQKLTLAALLSAHQRARRNKRFRPEIQIFEQRLVFHLLEIQDEILSRRYWPSNYRKFWTHDPKKRLIYALPYRDRIVHQFIVEEFLKSIFTKRFIATSYACILDRGAHRASGQAQKYLRPCQSVYGKSAYIIKLDISKFFYNINKDVLMRIFDKHIKNPDLLHLLRVVVYDKSPENGIPIGNYTSQYFANIYMNEADQYIKRALKVRYYIRYMDDMLLIVKDKSAARKYYADIEKYLNHTLKLFLNPKSCYFPANRPVDFCGYFITRNRMSIRQRSKKRLKVIISEYENHCLNQDEFIIRVNAWLGHVLHGDSMKYSQRMLAPYINLFPRLLPLAMAIAPERRIIKYEHRQRRD